MTFSTGPVRAPVGVNPILEALVPSSNSAPASTALEGAVFRWATVTSAQPLQIRFDAEVVPQAATPSLLNGAVNVGDRVGVLRQGMKDIVIGRTALSSDPARCQLFQNSSQSFTANVRTAVTWDTVNYDSASMWSSSADSVVIPATGLYSVAFALSFPTAATTHLRAYLMRNGSYVQGCSDERLGNASPSTILRASIDLPLNLGDTLQVHANPDAAISSKGSSLSDGSMFQVRRVA